MEVNDFILKYSQTKSFIQNPCCYIYDLDGIRANIKNIVDFKPSNVKLFYAIKANPNNEILHYMKKTGNIDGLEIASLGELKKSLKYFNSKDILFTGPAKTEKELFYAIKKGIRYINVESLVEAIRINNIAKKLGIKSVKILLRVNLDYKVKKAAENMGGFSSKMGIDEEKFIEIFKKVSELSNIEIYGIHAYSASGILDYNVLVRYANYVFKFVKCLQQHNFNIRVIDLGGGIGIDYTYQNRHFDTKKYFLCLQKLIKDFDYQDVKIFFELGCYLVGSAGYYVSKIIDIKDSKSYKHIVLAGGLNHIPTATLNGKHPIYFINTKVPNLYCGQPYVKDEVVDIDGPLCTAEDKVIWNEYVNEAHIGDLIVIKQAGAYCYSAAWLNFLSHELPKEILINKG